MASPFENFQVPEKYKDCNDAVDFSYQAIGPLKTLIFKFLDQEPRIRHLQPYTGSIKARIKEAMSETTCGTHEAVEVWALFWLYREQTGELLWSLKVVWGKLEAALPKLNYMGHLSHRSNCLRDTQAIPLFILHGSTYLPPGVWS